EHDRTCAKPQRYRHKVARDPARRARARCGASRALRRRYRPVRPFARARLDGRRRPANRDGGPSRYHHRGCRRRRRPAGDLRRAARLRRGESRRKLTGRAFTTWPCPTVGGGTHEEIALTFGGKRAVRVLVLPALFDEANKLRRLTVEVMQRLDGAGIDSVLPDLPGCNESRQPLEAQSLDHWRQCAVAAAAHFSATHVLTLRGGVLVAPPEMPGW